MEQRVCCRRKSPALAGRAKQGWSRNLVSAACKAVAWLPPSLCCAPCQPPTCGDFVRKQHVHGADLNHEQGTQDGCDMCASRRQVAGGLGCSLPSPTALCIAACTGTLPSYQHLPCRHALLLPAADAAQHGIAHLHGAAELGACVQAKNVFPGMQHSRLASTAATEGDHCLQV